MRCADVGCSKQIPLRIEPEPGKVSEHDGQSSSKSEGRDVFKEHEVGSYLANAVGQCRPDPAVVVCPGVGSGHAPRLTREASDDDIHEATPASAVEGDNVRPDRSLSQDAFRHTRDKDRGSKSFPLDVSDGAVVGDDQLKSKLEPADPGT